MSVGRKITTALDWGKAVTRRSDVRGARIEHAGPVHGPRSIDEKGRHLRRDRIRDRDVDTRGRREEDGAREDGRISGTRFDRDGG